MVGSVLVQGVNVELTEIEILILRGLDAKPALDVPGGIVDDNMSELIDIGYVSVRAVGNLFSYEITGDGRAALKRSEGGHLTRCWKVHGVGKKAATGAR